MHVCMYVCEPESMYACMLVLCVCMCMLVCVCMSSMYVCVLRQHTNREAHNTHLKTSTRHACTHARAHVCMHTSPSMIHRSRMCTSAHAERTHQTNTQTHGHTSVLAYICTPCVHERTNMCTHRNCTLASITRDLARRRSCNAPKRRANSLCRGSSSIWPATTISVYRSSTCELVLAALSTPARPHARAGHFPKHTGRGPVRDTCVCSATPILPRTL